MALSRISVFLLCAMVFAPMAACGKLGLRGQTVDLNSVSREKIQAFGVPIMRATVPARGIDVLLSIREQKGNVITWEAAEGYTFTFRDGILIETRGLGPDLMSAKAPSAGSIESGAVAQRSYFFPGDNDVSQRRDYVCTPQALAPEEITIYGHTHQTHPVTELCKRSQGKVTNQYWFEGGSIRQSVQWVGPAAGYAVFARVID